MLEEQRQHVCDLFRLTEQIIKRSISKKVEDTGVYRSQHKLLMILGSFPECSQTYLAEKLDISPAAVAVSLKKLEKAGYISRQCNENDNRVNHVVITPKGKEIIDISIRCFMEVESSLLNGFSRQELEQLEEYFTRIRKNGEAYYQSLLRQES